MGAYGSSGVTFVGINYAPEPTGISVYTTGMAEALADAGRRVNVVTGVPHYPQWEVYAGHDRSRGRHELNGVTLTRRRHFVPRRPRLANRALMELQFGVHAVLTGWDRPDVVVSVSPALLATGVALLKARLAGARTCVWVQDIYSLGIGETGGGGRLAGSVLRRLERRILRSADRVVVIHDRFRRYLVEELRVPAERIEVVRNWAHVDDTLPDRRAAVRAARGWDVSDVVVIHAGNMGAKQGLENVVEASRLAAERGSRVRFVLMGDGNRRDALEALGGNANLEFLDPVSADEFMPTLGAADVLLVNERPGLTEMCVPSKLTSYFSTGLPVLAATDAASVTAEELDAAGAGVRVDAADPHALLAAAEGLAADPVRASALGAAGLGFRERHLTTASAVERFAGILDSLDDALMERRAREFAAAPPLQGGHESIAGGTTVQDEQAPDDPARITDDAEVRVVAPPTGATPVQ